MLTRSLLLMVLPLATGNLALGAGAPASQPATKPAVAAPTAPAAAISVNKTVQPPAPATRPVAAATTRPAQPPAPVPAAAPKPAPVAPPAAAAAPKPAPVAAPAAPAQAKPVAPPAVAAAPTTKPAVAAAPSTNPAVAAAPATKPAIDGPTVTFARDVMPLINKIGCNAVACHGSPAGKAGLRLSMFGADPQTDYEALTRGDGGRRINKIEPAKSLMLLKASGALPHPLKQKLAADSPQYKLLLSWISQGAAMSREGEPALVSVTASAGEKPLKVGESVKLSATAAFSDGSKRDVMDLALFSSNDPSVVEVDASGTLTAKAFGEAVIVVNYLRQPATVRVTIPQPLPMPFPKVVTNNRVDELVVAKLKTLGIVPSDLCTEEEFVRRIYLDVTGTLPTAQEARAYFADRDPKKRSKLIDKLLAGEEFADYWAMKWSDLFRMKSEFPNTLWPNAVQAYHRWVRTAIVNNKPFDQFARELLTGSGSNFREPPVNFFRAFLKKDPQNVGDVAALTFMGARLGCARCHGHPTENWNAEDNLGLAAFFGQLRYKGTMEWKEEIVLVDTRASLRHPRSGDIVKPRLPGGNVIELQPGEDARVKFADWLTSPENPWFARSISNRIWCWLIGRGIVHEPDDLRPTNPPENPQLLDYLAKELVDHKYDLKHLYRLVLNSRTYQLSARTNQWNRNDVAHFSHYNIKRLGAETLLDAIGQVTGKWDTYQSIIPEPFVVLPPGFRATHLADGSVGVPFLELFGRPPRDTAYESERDLDLYVRQTLHLLNSTDVQNKIVNSANLAQMLKDVPEDGRIIEELYLSTVCRYPNVEDIARIQTYLNESYRLIEGGVAGHTAATEALQKIRNDIAKATADLEQAGKDAQDAQNAVAAAQNAEARAIATKAAAEKKQKVTALRAERDKLAALERPAIQKLAEANRRLEQSKTEARQRRVQVFQDLLWALINTKEFVFTH